jgi:LCP family protein required for cell wall assembly
MRTTLKRGIGRASAVNGNGHAVLPPAVVAPITRYEQPLYRRSGWARVRRFFFWVLAAVVMAAGGFAGGLYLYYHETVVGGLTAHSKDVKLASKKLDIPLPNAPAIALVVGYDKRLGKDADISGSRSDTVMLLRADPVSNSISMLSFPRDLQAELWCDGKMIGTDRINGAYGVCGSKGTLETVKHLTGLPVNYLITVDFHGFKQIVDRLGGVWIDVDRRYYNKNTGTSFTNFADINLWPGYQKLNGSKALDYVRFRHTDSDIYRIARQQQFVKGIKLQMSKNFSVYKALKVVGAITHNVEIGQAGGGSLEKALQQYALFAYDLPAGHFSQSKVNVTGENVLYAAPTAIAAAVQDFENPDVAAAQKATAVSFGSKAAGLKVPAPSHVTVSVVNGNGILGSATKAADGLGQRGYRIVTPQSTLLRNAPTFDYFHTKVYFDHTQPVARQAAQKIADLFGDDEVEALPPTFFDRANGAMVTVVVGSTFHGALAPAPVDRTPVKEPAAVRYDPAQSQSVLKSVRRRAGFQLMVPTVVESSSRIDSEVPLRLYYFKKHEKAVRLTFLSGRDISGYWGIEETTWKDAPVLQQPNFKHVIKGREYDFYYSGPHLHMVVLHVGDASYWVVNDLLDTLSNETMIAIAKGLKPLR